MKSQASFSPFPGCLMAEERSRIPASELGRWIFVAVLLLAGIVLYFRYAPAADPIVKPMVEDTAP